MFKFVQVKIFPMRKFLILIAFVFCSAALYGQVDTVRLGYSVQGNVVDAVTGRPMESVHVSVPGRHYATVTNADGDFTIKSDQPVAEVTFSFLGYRTLRQKPGGGPLNVRLTPESMPLAEASIITGDPREIIREAIYRISDNYSKNPELLECFYRETVRKRNRYIYVSEAVSRLYKTGYDGTVYRDRAALEKSRVLLSQRRTDTLSVKMQGGPTQAVTFVLITQLMAWFFSPWRPSLSFNLKPAWQMFGFSSKLMLTNIVNICNLHAFSVLLGKFFGDHTAGVYSNAKKWNDMASSTINGMVTSVAQPTLAQVAEDDGRYRQVFRKMLRFVCFVSFPAMLGLGLVAQEFILLAGGEKWKESGLILALLCIHGAFVPITTLYSNLTISKGRSDINMACTIGQCLAVWAGLILLYPYGFLPMVIYFVCLNIAWLVIWQWFAWRLTGLTYFEALKDIVPFLIFTLAVLALTWWLTKGIDNLWLLLISRVLLAATLYAGTMWLSGAKIMREAIHYIFNKGRDEDAQ